MKRDGRFKYSKNGDTSVSVDRELDCAELPSSSDKKRVDGMPLEEVVTRHGKKGNLQELGGNAQLRTG